MTQTPLTHGRSTRAPRRQFAARIHAAEARVVEVGDVLYLAEDRSTGRPTRRWASIDSIDGRDSTEYPRRFWVEDGVSTYATGMGQVTAAPTEDEEGGLVVTVRTVAPATPPTFMETELDDPSTGLPQVRAA